MGINYNQLFLDHLDLIEGKKFKCIFNNGDVASGIIHEIDNKIYLFSNNGRLINENISSSDLFHSTDISYKYFILIDSIFDKYIMYPYVEHLSDFIIFIDEEWIEMSDLINLPQSINIGGINYSHKVIDKLHDRYFFYKFNDGFSLLGLIYKKDNRCFLLSSSERLKEVPIENFPSKRCHYNYSCNLNYLLNLDNSYEDSLIKFKILKDDKFISNDDTKWISLKAYLNDNSDFIIKTDD